MSENNDIWKKKSDIDIPFLDYCFFLPGLALRLSSVALLPGTR